MSAPMRPDGPPPRGPAIARRAAGDAPPAGRSGSHPAQRPGLLTGHRASKQAAARTNQQIALLPAPRSVGRVAAAPTGRQMTAARDAFPTARRRAGWHGIALRSAGGLVVA